MWKLCSKSILFFLSKRLTHAKFKFTTIPQILCWLLQKQCDDIQRLVSNPQYSTTNSVINVQGTGMMNDVPLMESDDCKVESHTSIILVCLYSFNPWIELSIVEIHIIVLYSYHHCCFLITLILFSQQISFSLQDFHTHHFYSNRTLVLISLSWDTLTRHEMRFFLIIIYSNNINITLKLVFLSFYNRLYSQLCSEHEII